MFLRKLMNKSTKSYLDKLKQLKAALDEADAVVIGAGSGLSAAAGFTYSGERFERYFHDFAEKYHIRDIYSGGFYPFQSLEEYWAYKRFRGHRRRAEKWLSANRKREPKLFAHWSGTVKGLDTGTDGKTNISINCS